MILPGSPENLTSFSAIEAGPSSTYRKLRTSVSVLHFITRRSVGVHRSICQFNTRLENVHLLPSS